MGQLTELGEKIIKVAEKHNPSEVEVFLQKKDDMSVSIKTGEISEATKINSIGFGIRIIFGKKVGFAYSNRIDDKIIEKVVNNAVAIAKASKEIDDWKSLPMPKKGTNVQGIYDQKIEELTSEDVVNMAHVMLKSVYETDQRVIPIFGSSGRQVITKAILNNNGISIEGKGTGIFSALGAIAREGNLVTPYTFDLEINRIYEINPEKVGKKVAEQAVSMLKTTKAETGKYDVILTQDALEMLWTFTLMMAVKADAVQGKRSYFIDKIGTSVASEKLSILDDGTYPTGVRSSIFDDEGSPMQRKYIIEKGILKTYLYDNFTAKKEDKESTGNGFRGEAAVGSLEEYMLLPKPAPSNIVVETGDFSEEEMISEIKNGFIVWGAQGAHSSNPESGEISVVATPCFKIENGEIVGSTPGIMLSGNMYEMLKKNIKAIGKNIMKRQTLIAPWITFSDVAMIVK